MEKTQNLFDACEHIVDELRKLEQNTENYHDVFVIRRKLQAAQIMYLKQGDRVPVVKEFEIKCAECGQVQLREDDYYLHLRKTHNYPDDKAVKGTRLPRMEYESGLHDLRRLLAEYTEVQLEDD